MRTGLKNINKNMNTQRELWNAAFGDGTPGDFEQWYLWDPTPQEADQLVAHFQTNHIRPSDIDKGKVGHMVPRYVRLSDSAIGVVVKSQAPATQLGEYWPLDFTTVGKPRDKRESFGHAWMSHGRITSFKGTELRGSLDDHPGNEHLPTIWVSNLGDPQSSIYGTMAPNKFKYPGSEPVDNTAEAAATAETEEEPEHAGGREMDDDMMEDEKMEDETTTERMAGRQSAASREERGSLIVDDFRQ
ncbi:MAG: hypothetical protein Q9196_002810 [Gyalolechia fulgens]